MALDRQAVKDALFLRLQTDLADLVKSFTLLEEGGAGVTDAHLPQLVLSIGKEDVDASERNRPPLWRLHFDIIVYTLPSPTSTDPDTQHVEIASAIETALEWHTGEDNSGWWTTLGNTVSRAYPVGPVDYQSAEVNVLHRLTVPVEVVIPTTVRGRPS